MKPIHLTSGDEGKTMPKADSLYIDIGASDKEDALKYVNLGDRAVICSEYTETEDKIKAKALDDRVGCANLIRLIKEYDEYDFYATFTVQEETALPAIGGLVLANAIQPDAAIAIDVCQTADTPDAPQMDTWLGKGASILVRDTTLIADKALTDDMVAAAKEAGIPYQLLVALEGGTDAVPMQQAGRGCRVNVLSVPMKYLHTSAEMADLADAENVLDLTVLLCNRPFSF